MIGVFGGTFDPVHYGHLRSALEVKEIFGLEQIRLIPSAQPPHRQTPQASAVNRMDMLKLAIESVDGFVADNREIERTGPSYMVITLAALRREYPASPLLLFIGGDAFKKLTTWHEWRHLFNYAHIVVLTRPNYPVEPAHEFFITRLTSSKEELVSQLSGKLFFQAITQLDISATAIRKMVGNRQDPRFLLPDAVIAYIYQHQLYQS